ncbi:uncharacterized protein LOC117118482 [Anneissia japonica]|uniref:uncharacterized protein LOC117118482 n=1 Tax=Anneissia japonica TaxID=1529436 RepID=UPI00142573D9|nr:uncharacterized protein LOC117118482 [Anneissia japonica]
MAELRNVYGWIAFTLLILGGVNAETPCDTDSKAMTIANQEECLSQITTAALEVDRSAVSPNDTLSVYMELLFCSQNEELIVCCESICAQGVAVEINPLDPTTLENYQLRNKPRISFYPSSMYMHSV